MKRLVCAYLCIALLAGLAGCGVTKESYLAKGNAFFDAGKYDDASLNYRKAIQKDTNFGEAYYRLGLTAIKFWTRTEFHGCNDLKKKINPTRVPIGQKESIRWLENLRQSTALLNDPQRCIHIGDRESDIYELFCAAQQVGTHFLVRTCVDRLAGDGTTTIADEMKQVRVQGLYRIEVRDKEGAVSEAVLEIRFCRTVVLPPIGKQIT